MNKDLIEEVYEDMPFKADGAVSLSLKEAANICEKSGEEFSIEKALLVGKCSLSELFFVKVIAKKYELNPKEVFNLLAEATNFIHPKFNKASEVLLEKIKAERESNKTK